MTLPVKAAVVACACEILLSPSLIGEGRHALPLTHLPGFIIVWDREPVFEFSLWQYTVMVATNIAVLWVFWLIVLLLVRAVRVIWRRVFPQPSDDTSL